MHPIAFFVDPAHVPSNAMQGQYDWTYVALSYVIAVVAARIALLALQDISIDDRQSRLKGCALGGIIMGSGIWSMRFTGMLAYKMTMYHTYSVSVTVFSLLIAIGVAWFVFYNITRENLNIRHILWNAPLLGLGVAFMHYAGMGAMEMDGSIVYIPTYFWLSIVIAIAASGAAMWIMHSIVDIQKYKNLLSFMASCILGIAVCGMHYMGMAASIFIPNANCRFVMDQNDIFLVIFVGFMTVTILAQGLFLISKGFLKKTSTREKIFSRYGFYFSIFGICFIGLGIMGCLHKLGSYDEEIAKENFVREQQMDMSLIRDKFSDFFKNAYAGLRTISRLPSVRDIDRYGKNLNTNDRITIQENYNNLYHQTGVSEVYIVSKDFNPDQINPITKKPGAPIIAFDEMIVGRTKDDYVHPDKKESMREDKKENQKASVEELEIEEYHLIVEQIAYFQKHYPTLDAIKEYDIPAIGGREVITCDNSRYSPKNPKDADRSGFVYSVPFYGMDGRFKGVVSTIFLTHVFRDFIGTKNVAFINTANKSPFLPHTISRQLEQSLPHIQKGEVDPSLFYSEVIPLVSYDVGAHWKLWSGVSNSIFYDSSHYNTIMQFLFIGDGIIIFSMIIGIVAVFLMHRNYTLKEYTLRKAIIASEVANMAKSEFLANMSHELRTPMHAILNYSTMGLKRLSELNSENDMDEKDGKLTKFFSNIKASGERLLLLLNDLLDLSKLESGKMDFNMTVGGLYDAVDHSLNELDALIHRKNIIVDIMGLHIAKRKPVHHDKQRMIQVFVNVISNAIKFSPHNSYMQIEYKLGQKGAENESLLCIIRDQGSGIPLGEEEKIFDKFIQSSKTKTGAGGTGLGLSICKEIVEAHQGRIWARNCMTGTGAEFLIELPTHVDVEQDIHHQKTNQGEHIDP